MIPTRKPRVAPIKVNLPSFTDEYVRSRLPEIRDKILYLRKLIKRQKNIDKIQKLSLKIKNLCKERIKIMNNLPKTLHALARIHEININGFEQSLTACHTIMLNKDVFTFKPQKVQCQSVTNKGKQCSRKGTSHCGKYCKIHDPASAHVRKITHSI